MQLRRNARSLAGSAFGVALAAFLVVASINAGLQVPDVEYVRGYPSAAALGVGRPAGGFAPLSHRFIANVLGVRPGSAEGAPARVAPRGEVSVAGAAAAPRVTVRHPFTNDAFARAYVVPAVPFTARTDTRSATREPNEPASCSGVGGTAWYRFTATRDRVLFATTFGSNHATSVAAFRGERMGALTQVDCHRSPTGNAQVGFPGRAGETYYFQVTGVAGGGDTVFNLDPLGRTERVSVSSTGEEGNNFSYWPAISGDGRFVAFHSSADNLTSDSPGCPLPAAVPALARGCISQVFVHDRTSRTTSLVSVSSAGEPGNANSQQAALSADGRYVAFQSSASNLGMEDGTHIYVRDRLAGTTEVVSADSGSRGNQRPSISANGRYVAFSARRFLPGLTDDPNCIGGIPPPRCVDQIFVYDRVARTTTLASKGAGGEMGSGSSRGAAISADGSAVAFRSFATNLVPQDTDELQDMYVHDLRRGVTELISVSTSGIKGNAASGDVNDGGPAQGVKGIGYVSADGRYVAFQSEASNLVADDTNGASDFFVRDRVLRTTVRVNLSSSGEQGRARTSLGTALTTAGGIALSADGRYVAFDSGLLYGEDDGARSLSVYVRDLFRGVTVRVSVSSLGEPGDYHSMTPALSAGGEFVTFFSGASNLVEGDNNVGCVAPGNTATTCPDIFIHELGEYTRPG